MKYINTFIALDTETGGFTGAEKPATITVALTEVALVVIDNESLEIINKDSWLIKPYADDLIYSPGAEKASGISKQMCINEGIELEDVYKNIVTILKANKNGSQKPILIMQNKKFDTPFIENLFMIFSDDLYKYIERIEDTLHWARYKFIEKPNFKLGSIADYCDLTLTNAHRALYDTIVTAKIWVHFMKYLRGSIGGSVEKKEEGTHREGFSL